MAARAGAWPRLARRTRPRPGRDQDAAAAKRDRRLQRGRSLGGGNLTLPAGIGHELGDMRPDL